MSLEDAVLKLTKAIEANTKALGENQSGGTVEKRTAPKTKKSLKEDDVLNALHKLEKSDGKAILKTFGVKKLKDLDEKYYQEVIDLCVKKAKEAE